MKKTISILLVLATILSLCACGTTKGQVGNSDEDNRKGNDLVEIVAPKVDETRKSTANSDELYSKIILSIDTQPTSMMPLIEGATPCYFWLIYECLFDLVDGEYLPALGKDYTIVDDTHWDVEIWDNIHDSVGNAITADDVVASYDWLISTGKLTKFSLYKSVEKLDEYTIRFTWTEKPVAINALEYIFCRTAILDTSVLGTDEMSTGAPSTGPYTVTEFVSGSKIVLDRDPNYWAADMGDKLPSGIHVNDNVQTIEYSVITEAAQAAIALQTGTIDFSSSVASTSLSSFREGGQYADDYVVTQTAEVQYYVGMYNCYEGCVTADENLRQALSYCVDNSALYKVVGEDMMPAYAYGSPAYDDYEETWEALENGISTYDVEKAKEYLDNSNYDGEKLVLIAANSTAFKNLLTMIQAFYTAIGVDSEIKLLDSATLSETIKDPEAFDVYFRAVGGQNLVGSWNMTVNFDSTATGIVGYNATVGYVNDEEMFDQYALTNTAEGHTTENMTKLMEMFVEHAYVYPLCVSTKTYVYTNDIADIGIEVYHYPYLHTATYYLD